MAQCLWTIVMIQSSLTSEDSATTRFAGSEHIAIKNKVRARRVARRFDEGRFAGAMRDSRRAGSPAIIAPRD
jgi:hypothetical protein